MSLTATSPAATAEVREGLDPRQQEAIRLLASGMSVPRLVEKLDISRSTLIRWRAKPEALAYLEALQFDRDMAAASVLKTIEDIAPKAVGVLDELVNDLSEETPAHVRLNAAKDVLDRAGYQPVSKSQQHIVVTHATADDIAGFKARGREILANKKLIQPIDIIAEIQVDESLSSESSNPNSVDVDDDRDDRDTS